MGKIKNLLIDAAEYRMAEIHCEYEEAHEWVENQSITFLLQYVAAKESQPDPTIDDVIEWFKSCESDLNEYEKKALKLLMDYKDVLDHNLHMARYE